MRFIQSLSVVFLTIFAIQASAADIRNITVKSVEVYTSKDKIPDIGGNGWIIPANTPVVVMRAAGNTHEHWRFVAYGETLKESLALWTSAKLSSKPAFCETEDRGNYWVQCVGTGLE